MDIEQKTSPKKKGLGRGLDALLGAARAPAVAVPGAEDASGADAPAEAGSDRVTHLPLEFIQRGRYQPRRDFDPDALRELADSIVAQGVIQPIVVRPVPGSPAGPQRYEIIAGERRWRACQQAGLAEIPVVIREVDEPTALAIGLIENIQRADLNPLEESGALERLISEFGLTHQQVAEAVGKSRTMVTNLLRLQELNPDVKDYVEQSRLEMGHARALLGLKGAAQSQAARSVVAAGLSVRETEKLVRRLQQAGEAEETARSQPELDPDIRRLQSDLTDRLGASVQIQHGSRGSGKLVIAYNNLDELDGILAHIK
ncbi:ParB/RepB/Spo0J family partition protein [Imhoffiella purpurea]|uniref:Probable chromosome-partitioning protein ParB n=1 Tax=Imhoffiella purpurea TaxID=1249627 RepID=W9V3D3_9GAMM|nr:ParB/RepB/Spo0J family partition protein [Imhoffiella purpurea]EXJ14023.1 Chromosome (plasmid) partitioning protein ParB [Imhoffiella purpurea]